MELKIRSLSYEYSAMRIGQLLREFAVDRVEPATGEREETEEAEK